MKSLSVAFLIRRILLLVILNPNILLAQCESVNNNSASEIGPYNVESISEEDGMRNGPNYSGATLFYPENGTPPLQVLLLFPVTLL